MPTLLDYRRRIRSVRNTQQITRAMKFVAAANLRRAQERVFAARPYSRQILHVIRSAVARIESPTHPLLFRRPEERLLVLVLTGDKGLCGAFNANVLKRAAEFLVERQKRGQQVRIIAVGKKGRDTLRKRGWELTAEYLNLSQHVEFMHAKEISEKVAAFYASEEVDAAYAVYNEFKSVLVQRLMVEKLLPVDPGLLIAGDAERPQRDERAEPLPIEAEREGTALLVDYIYEQPPAELFRRLVPRYLDAEVYRVLLESAAAEHAARMTAMDSATNNAGDLIGDLTLQMNKIRQAAITREIIEVVSGAAWAAS